MALLRTLRHRATFPVTTIAMVLITVQAVVAVVANTALAMAAAMAAPALLVGDVCKDSHIHALREVRHLLAVRLLGNRVRHHLRHAVGQSQSVLRSLLLLLTSSQNYDLPKPRLLV